MRNLPRVYTSFMPNAPILNGVPGALLDIIKKCLNGGWTPFDSIGITVSAGKGIIKFAEVANVSFPDGCILSVSGCDEPQLNKEWFITLGNSKEAHFDTTVADGTYGGTIKVIPAPAGWDLMFSGTNTSVIRSSNQDSSRTVVQIVDTAANTCSFEFGTDALAVDRIIDNTRAEMNVDRCIIKSRNADANNFRGWTLVADNTTVYFIIDIFSFGGGNPLGRDGIQGGRVSFFGDYIPNDKTDKSCFAAYFQAANVGQTINSDYGDGSPQISGVWTESWTYARGFVKSSLFRFNKYYWGVFCCQADIANPTWRQSGSPSNLDMAYVTNLEKSHRRMGVYTRGAGGGTAIGVFGYLPGIRYSDYFIRAMFGSFTSSVDNETNTRFTYVPIDWGTRDNNNFTTNWGLVPFIVGQKWGD